jgi:hypothetical protein
MMVPKMRCGRMLRRVKRNSGSQGRPMPSTEGTKSEPISMKSTAVPPRLNATGKPTNSRPTAAANIASPSISRAPRW